MSGHAIRDGVAVCNEPDTALCRAKWSCDCEWHGHCEQVPGGAWTHVGQWDGNVIHRSRGTIDCNVCSWINGDGLSSTNRTVSDYAYGWDQEWPDGDLIYEWGDEWVEWEYADPRIDARIIARAVVEAWADDKGYAA